MGDVLQFPVEVTTGVGDDEPEPYSYGPLQGLLWALLFEVIAAAMFFAPWLLRLMWK